VLAAIAAAVFLPVAALTGHRQPYAHAHRAPVTVTRALRAAWHAPGFRRWVIASLISGAAVDVILVYQVPVMIAAGLPIAAAASVGGLGSHSSVVASPDRRVDLPAGGGIGGGQLSHPVSSSNASGETEYQAHL
jgi:hypothetical protein